MLEYLIAIHFGKAVGRMAEDKGHDGGLWTALFVIAWFVGEALGLVLALSLVGAAGGHFFMAYLIGALVALGGVSLVALIVLVLPDNKRRMEAEKVEYDIWGQPIRKQRKKRPRARYDDYEDREPRRRRRRLEDEEDDRPAPRRRRYEDDRDLPRTSSTVRRRRD